MSRGGSDVGRYTAIARALHLAGCSVDFFITTACVEMGPVYAQTGVVVHGKPQLLACMKPVTCLRHLGSQGSFGRRWLEANGVTELCI